MSKKILTISLLVVLLLVPVLVFVFLKGFGKNYYELPYVGPKTFQAATQDSLPYQVPEQSFSSLDSQRVFLQKGQLYVISLWPEKNFDSYHSEFVRLQQKDTISQPSPYFNASQVNLFCFWQGQQAPRKDLRLFKQFWLKPALKEKIYKDFMLNKSHTMALVDENLHVRGIYDMSKSEEFDRLAIEIKVYRSEKNNPKK